jgi:hypothetical protein
MRTRYYARVAGLTLLGSSVAAIAFAMAPEDPIQEAKDHVPPCLVHDAAAPLHSPGARISPTEYFSCWVRPIGSARELVVGNATAVYDDTSPTKRPWADAFFDAEDCGWDDAVGSVPSSLSLRLRLGGISFIDSATTDGGYSDVKLEYVNVSSCSFHPGTRTGNVTTFCSSDAGRDWNRPMPSGFYVDIPYPTGGGTKSYNYKITTRVCDATPPTCPTTSNCSTSSDEGCFQVTWN